MVGAGPAGLACAAQMQPAGLVVVVLEKADSVGAVWRRHYDRLHLHTDRNHSGLPGLPMPASYPKYPSRAQVVAYLESYATHFAIQPLFGTTVTHVVRDGAHWCIEAERSWRAPIVVIATGTADAPYRPSWPGMEAYRGAILHSSAYRNPAPFAGQRVLVVGFGNSGGEIALDLAEAGVEVTLAVRDAGCGLERLTRRHECSVFVSEARRYPMASYTATITWTLGEGEDFRAGRYSRGHAIAFDGGSTVAGSASPHVVGKKWSLESAVDPEEMLVAALSSCHMLSFLYCAQQAGFAVADYRDHAEGAMAEIEPGRQAVTEVTLHPQIKWDGAAPDASKLDALHRQAHEICFIANSVKTRVIIDG